MRFSSEQIKAFEGVYSALLTPFDKHGDVSEEALRRLTDFQLDAGLDGFFVCGSTGEGILLTTEERKRVAEIVVDQARDRGTVIVHVGHASSAVSAELAAHAETIGADAIGSVPPIYYPLGIEEALYHYQIITRASSLPFVAYNIPSLTSVGLSAGHLPRLLEMETFVGMKFTGYDLYEMQGIAEALGDAGIVLSGSDQMSLPALLMGARGSIGSTHNIVPGKFVGVYRAYKDGDISTAKRLQEEINRLMRVVHRYGMPSRKAYLRRLGIDCGVYRPPFKPLTDEQEREFFAEVDALGA